MVSIISILVVTFSEFCIFHFNPFSFNNCFSRINIKCELYRLYNLDPIEYNTVHYGPHCRAYYNDGILPDNLEEWEYWNVTLNYREANLGRRVDSHIDYISIKYHVNGLDIRTRLRSLPTGREYIRAHMRAVDAEV